MTAVEKPSLDFADYLSPYGSDSYMRPWLYGPEDEPPVEVLLLGKPAPKDFDHALLLGEDRWSNYLDKWATLYGIKDWTDAQLQLAIMRKIDALLQEHLQEYLRQPIREIGTWPYWWPKDWMLDVALNLSRHPLQYKPPTSYWRWKLILYYCDVVADVGTVDVKQLQLLVKELGFIGNHEPSTPQRVLQGS